MKRPLVIGLTGSIGMGKEHDSRDVRGGRRAGVGRGCGCSPAIRVRGGAGGTCSALCPDAVIDGAVRREVLKDWIDRDPAPCP
jgi:dephospho-CoA kinase